MKRYRSYLATLTTLGLLTAGISLAPSASAQATNGAAFNATLLITPGDPTEQVLETLMKEYSQTHPGSTLTVTTIVQTQLDQKLDLLASAGDLPTMFIGPQDPSGQEQMGKAGYALNMQTALTKLGVINELKPSAVKIIDTLQGGLYSIPDQLAMEGFWYNKKIFAKYGVKAPTTWGALVSDAAALNAKGVQPFAADGMDGWPLTRLISGYIFRELGPNALLKVEKGQSKLTSKTYVEAAQAAAALGTAGYFGKGFATLGYTPAEEEFLTGKAAMFYMGTWALPDYSNATLGNIGASNVGFFPFPAVSGGSGNANETPENCGEEMMFSAKAYTPADADWLKFVAQNFGTVALKAGDLTGFDAAPGVKAPNSLLQLALNQIAKTQTPVLWFEAYFNAKATSVAQENAAPLFDGSITASNYMSMVQSALSTP